VVIYREAFITTEILETTKNHRNMLGCNSHSKCTPLRSATDDASGHNSSVMSLLKIDRFIKANDSE